MRSPAIIVLGGGEDQLPAYVEGRRRGFTIIGVDQNQASLGAALADEFVPLTTRDHRAIARAVGQRPIAAVISPASDAAQESVAALRAHYGTPQQVSAEVLRASVDKAAFHQVSAALGFSTYRHHQSADHDRLAALAASTLDGPNIVKPSDSSGSKGLSYLPSPAGLREAIARAAGHSPSGAVIVEEYVLGDHLSSESFLVDGEVAFISITDRVLTPPPHLISQTHIVPADIGRRVEERFVTMVGRIAEATGYRDGPLNVDFILTPDGRIVLVEIGARLGGNGLPLLVRHTYGIDTVAAALDLALGLPPGLTPRFQRMAMLHILGADRDGVLETVAGLDQARRLAEVVALEVFKQPGDDVFAYTQAGNKLGYVVLVAPDRQQLLEAQRQVLASLDFIVTRSPSPLATSS